MILSKENKAGGNLNATSSSHSLRGLLLVLFCSLGLLFSSFAVAGDFDLKIDELRIVYTRSGDVGAGLKMAVYLARDGRYDEAIKVYDEILQKDPTDIPAELGLARVNAWKGDYARARELYDSLMLKYPSNYEVYQGLGFLMLWNDDFEKSIEYFKKAIALNSKDIESLKGIARAYDEKGDRVLAEKYFDQAYYKELKSSGAPYFGFMILGLIIVIVLPFLVIRRHRREVKKERLILELRLIRAALYLYHHKHSNFPLALELLMKGSWVPPGRSSEEPFLEVMATDDKGVLLDPFGVRYMYSPDRGVVHSVVRGCEKL